MILRTGFCVTNICTIVKQKISFISPSSWDIDYSNLSYIIGIFHRENGIIKHKLHFILLCFSNIANGISQCMRLCLTQFPLSHFSPSSVNLSKCSFRFQDATFSQTVFLRGNDLFISLNIVSCL